MQSIENRIIGATENVLKGAPPAHKLTPGDAFNPVPKKTYYVTAFFYFFITICIAAIGTDKDGKEAVVFASDHMVSIGNVGQFDKKIEKYA